MARGEGRPGGTGCGPGSGAGSEVGYKVGYKAGYNPTRPWTPLALTLGLHLLLVLAWLGGMHGKPRREPLPRVSVLVPVFLPARPLPPPESRPASGPKSRPESRPEAAAPSSSRVHQPAPAALPAPALPALAVPEIAVQAPVAPVRSSDAGPGNPQEAGSDNAQEQAPAALPGDLLATSKAMAGRIGHEPRKGASPSTAEPERKWERFAEAFATARTGGPRTVTLDSYTSPDGVIIYRKTVGNRVACYRSGSVGGLVTGFGSADGQGAGGTECPSGVRWTRH